MEGPQGLTHHMTVLVLQLAVILISAKILGYLFQRFLKQPRVLGELVAGMIIGPYALGQFSIGLLGQPLFPIGQGVLPVSPELYGFASVASIVLLFLAGLETDLPTFLRFSLVGSLVGLGGAAVAYFAGSTVAIWVLPEVTGYLHPVALFLGVLSTATSVGITARILSDKRQMSSPEGVSILSAAVLDDVIGIILLAVVVGIVRSEGPAGPIDWGQIGIIAGKAVGFWLGFTVIGILLAPKLIKGLKVFRSMDVLAGTTFGLALFLSGLSETAGLAMIIGAYVTGLSLSQTDIAHQLRERLAGLYDFLVPVFFCVMGMLVDFSAFAPLFWFGLLYTAMAIVGKLVGCGVPALFTGFNLKGALRIGLGML
ncbi:MAG: cation:proton antiporter, partial [Spirochaetota bacterium]